MAYTNDEELKVVLNVRDKRHISLLTQIKEEVQINYQNMIRLGVLFLFQEEAQKVERFAQEVQAPVSEGYEDLLKVHITFAGKTLDTIKQWRIDKGLTPHQIARMGLETIYRFFTRTRGVQSTFASEPEPVSQPVAPQSAVTQAPVVKPAPVRKEGELNKYLNRKDSLLEFLMK